MSAEAVVVLISAIAGVIGMPIINLFKKLTGASDGSALAVATVVSVLIGAGVSFLNGAFVGFEFTLPGLIQASGIVFSVATVVYKSLGAKMNSGASTDPGDEGSYIGE